MTTGDALTISAAQLGYLLKGIDWRVPIRMQRERRRRRLDESRPVSMALLYDGGTIGIPLEAVGGDALISGID